MPALHRSDARTMTRVLILAAALLLVFSALPGAEAQQDGPDILALLEDRRREIRPLMERPVVYVLLGPGDSASNGHRLRGRRRVRGDQRPRGEGKGKIMLVNPVLKPVRATLVRREYGGGLEGTTSPCSVSHRERPYPPVSSLPG